MSTKNNIQQRRMSRDASANDTFDDRRDTDPPPPPPPPTPHSYFSMRLFGQWLSPNLRTRPPPPRQASSTTTAQHPSAHLALAPTPSTGNTSTPATSQSPQPAPHIRIIMDNDPKAFKGEPALTRYLNAMDHDDNTGAANQPGGLLQDPGHASSVTHIHSPQIRYSNEHAKNPFAFLRILLFGRQKMGFFWFIKKVAPQLVIGLLLNLAVDLFDIKETGWWSIRADTQRLHAFVGAILAFVLVFRSNGCYDRYYEARKTLGLITNQAREIILEVCSMFTKEGDNEHIHIYRNEIRRKVNILIAFIRQNIRESHVGFMPNSNEGTTPFHEGDNFIRDPVRPRLCDLLTPAEVVAYSKVSVSARAACVASEIKGIAQLLSKHVEMNISLYTRVSQCCQICLDAQETLYRIITTPMPFPYTWILNAMLMIFVFSVPFLYDCYRGGSYFGTVILIIGYYGLHRIAEQCENPLEWDACDLDIEALTMWIHDETRDISTFTHAQNLGFIPANIRSAKEKTDNIKAGAAAVGAKGDIFLRTNSPPPPSSSASAAGGGISRSNSSVGVSGAGGRVGPPSSSPTHAQQARRGSTVGAADGGGVISSPPPSSSSAAVGVGGSGGSGGVEAPPVVVVVVDKPQVVSGAGGGGGGTPGGKNTGEGGTPSSKNTVLRRTETDKASTSSSSSSGAK